MADLFGKPDPAPPKPWLPFYCHGCAGTRSRKCPHCGRRRCERGRNCPGGECDCRLQPNNDTGTEGRSDA